MRSRSKPRVVWLPPTNAFSVGMAGQSGYQTFILQPLGVLGDFVVGEIPLTIDAQSDPLSPATSLADVESSGYRLRRIVGKIFCVVQQEDADTPIGYIVTAGLIVRAIDTPTGTSLASLDTTGETFDPGQIRNYGDPWIWRRSWMLGNNNATNAPVEAFDWATANHQLPSAVDGPHVDQKTARIVGAEERLFLDVGVTIVKPGGDPLEPGLVQVFTDLRCLASMRTSTGNRRNASR